MEESQSLLHKPTVAFLMPLLVFLVIVQVYPSFAGSQQSDSGTVSLDTKVYMAMLVSQILIASAFLVYFKPVYVQHFPLKISPLSIFVGVAGIVVWVGICGLEIEEQALQWIGLGSSAVARPSFNPFEHLPTVGWQIAFLVPRFFLLAVIVPIIEELFLRGWVVRFVHDPDWESVSLTQLSWAAVLAPTVYGVVTHPGEAVAAIVWFSLVTLLMLKTGNLWDCVVAHAVTNLLLGVYVIWFSQWHLW
jgi:CAAX prenyl protease-like protein